MWSRLEHVLQFAVGAAFLLSVLPKIWRPREFVSAVVNYRILPERLATAFAIVVIPTEVCLAVSHLTGLGVAIAAPIGIIMLTAFLLGVGRNLAIGRPIACGCFGGTRDEPISFGTLARLALLVVAEGILAGRLASLNGAWSVALPSVSVSETLVFWIPSVVCVLLAVTWVSAIADIRVLLRKVGHASN